MNTKTILAKLTKDHTEAKNAAKTADNDLRNFLNPRVRHLHSVGHSVITSVYGTERAASLSLTEVDPEFHWLISPWMEIVSINDSKVKVNTSIYAGQKHEFVVDASIIHMSDRDYASRVRKSIKRKKDYRNEVERKRALEAVNKLREELAAAEEILSNLKK